MIVPPRKEVLDDAHVMAGIDVDDIETGLLGANGGVAIPAAHVGDIGLVHGARLNRVEPVANDMRRGKRDHPAETIGDVKPVVNQLDCSQTAMRMDLVRDKRQRADIAVIPQPGLVGRRQVGGRVDFRLLCRDHRPTTFRLDPAHLRLGIGIAIAHAGTVGHLVEAVSCRQRSDFHRFEKHVVAGISHRLAVVHSAVVASATVCRTVCDGRITGFDHLASKIIQSYNYAIVT